VTGTPSHVLYVSACYEEAAYKDIHAEQESCKVLTSACNTHSMYNITQ
jgi:hypothetical protein